MKKLQHRGRLYIVSMALVLLGLVGVSYTASAQVLWVLGEKVSDPLNNDFSRDQAGYDLDNVENWNGHWSWDHNTKTLLIKNINSNKPVQGIYAKDISGFTIKVEGECTFGTSAKNKSVVESDGCGIIIEGVGDNAELLIRTKRGSSHGIRISKNADLFVRNCLVDVSSENCGITGAGNGEGVGIKLIEGGRIEAKGGKGAIVDIRDYIQVFENGEWVSINSSSTYARTTQDDAPLRYEKGNIVYLISKRIVISDWAVLTPYYPVSVAGYKFHRYRTKLTPDGFPSTISAGSLEYIPNEHKIILTDATIVSDDKFAAITSYHPSKYLQIGCKGANKITTTGSGSAIRVSDKSSPTIYGVEDNASLELYPSTSDNYPGIWDETEENYLVVRDIDLKIRSKAGCIYTNKDNKTVSLQNLNATLTTVSDWSLISGFKTLEIYDAYISSPLGAVVDGGTIKLNGTNLQNTTCEIKRGSAPTYNVTIDSGIKHGRIRVTNYSGSLSSVPLGTKLKVEATPDAGYHVTKILAGGENITSSKEFVVTRNAEISAQFDIDKYNVTSSSSSGGSISLSHSGSVAYGTTITVTVKPDGGYKLAKLTANGVDITATKKFVVQAATTVAATFTRDNAIEEVATTDVLLFPNPAAEATTLSGVEPGAMVQVLSLDGVEVLRTAANEVGVARLDLAGVVAGKYLVKSGETTLVLLVTK